MVPPAHDRRPDQRQDLAKLAWPDVAALLARPGGCAAILPIGSTEAHGPHLPLDTDVTIALGMARRAAVTLAERGRAAVVLPPVTYSVTDFAGPFAGTLSLPKEAAVALLAGVLGAAARAGFAPLAVANAHLEPAHVTAIRAGHPDFLAAGGSQAYFGAPAEASAEEGRATYAVLAALLVEAIEGA